MEFKHDLEMWHKLSEAAEWFKLVSKSMEFDLINKCTYYYWDNISFEEYCRCPYIKWDKDFIARTECWKCPYFKLKK